MKIPKDVFNDEIVDFSVSLGIIPIKSSIVNYETIDFIYVIDKFRILVIYPIIRKESLLPFNLSFEQINNPTIILTKEDDDITYSFSSIKQVLEHVKV